MALFETQQALSGMIRFRKFQKRLFLAFAYIALIFPFLCTVFELVRCNLTVLASRFRSNTIRFNSLYYKHLKKIRIGYELRAAS